MDEQSSDNVDVAHGVLDLCPGASPVWFRDHVDWLKGYFVRHGLNPAHIRRDVIADGHRFDMLDTRFSILLVLYAARLRKRERYGIMAVANDCDPDGPHPAEWTHRNVCSQLIRRRDLPELRWPPFKLVPRVHAWDFHELAAFTRRQPQ
jgi:hypothetical protein